MKLTRQWVSDWTWGGAHPAWRAWGWADNRERGRSRSQCIGLQPTTFTSTRACCLKPFQLLRSDSLNNGSSLSFIKACPPSTLSAHLPSSVVKFSSGESQFVQSLPMTIVWDCECPSSSHLFLSKIILDMSTLDPNLTRNHKHYRHGRQHGHSRHYVSIIRCTSYFVPPIAL